MSSLHGALAFVQESTSGSEVTALGSLRARLVNHRRPIPRVAFLLVLFASLTGCKTFVMLSPDELRKLDGYQYGDVVPLKTLEGGTYEFGPRTGMLFVMTGGTYRKLKFQSISVSGDHLEGRTFRGRVMNLDLRDVWYVYVGHRDIPRTVIGIVLLGILGFAVLVGLFWLIFIGP